MNLRVVLDTWKILPRYWRTFVRSSFIGFWMGFKPGGATPASFMSYAFAKRFSKNADRFGKGEIEGVVAPETAAHAAGSRGDAADDHAGHPGSPTAAVMLGGLIIWGLQPGPLLFNENPDFVWGLIASMYTGNVIGVVMVLAFVPLFAAILRIPFAILTPLIVVVCAIGSYAVHNSMLDIWYMLIFGVIGYVFKKLDYPLAPLVLALVLGDLAENALRQSLIMSQGSLAIFLQPADRRSDHRGGDFLFHHAHYHSVVAATARFASGSAGAAGNLTAARRSIDGIASSNGILGSLARIVIIDLSLAGDNALVIAMAVLTLTPRQPVLRWKSARCDLRFSQILLIPQKHRRSGLISRACPDWALQNRRTGSVDHSSAFIHGISGRFGIGDALSGDDTRLTSSFLFDSWSDQQTAGPLCFGRSRKPEFTRKSSSRSIN